MRYYFLPNNATKYFMVLKLNLPFYCIQSSCFIYWVKTIISNSSRSFWIKLWFIHEPALSKTFTGFAHILYCYYSHRNVHGLGLYMQLLTRLGWDEQWWGACWKNVCAGSLLLYCGWRCEGKLKKCSLKVAHSPKVIPRRALSSSASPKMSAEPLILLFFTLSVYWLSKCILSI